MWTGQGRENRGGRRWVRVHGDEPAAAERARAADDDALVSSPITLQLRDKQHVSTMTHSGGPRNLGTRHLLFNGLPLSFLGGWG